MPIEIRLPRLGWSMDEGTFLGWLKESGEQVHAGEPLFTLENDKAAQDVESIDSGRLIIPAGAPKTGDVVKVGELLGYLVAENEEPSAVSDSSDSGEPLARQGAATLPQQVLTNEAPEMTAVPLTPLMTEMSVMAENGRAIKASPRARRAAAQYGIDLTAVKASGAAGRISEDDVLANARSIDRSRFPAPSSPLQSDGTAVPVSAIRRTIAERMLQSQRQTAPVTLTCRVDATNLVALRHQFKTVDDGMVPSYTDIIAKLTAFALQKHPMLMCQLHGDQLVQASAVHIGIAVDTEQGLVVPVLRDVLSMSLLELARRSTSLIEAARNRRLRAAEVQGGSFTITNLGSYGVEAFTPIINLPEAAVLGLGCIKREPVVLDDGSVGVSQQLMLSLTFDHRIVDGAPAARFLQTLRQGIENPAAWLLT